MGWLHEAPLNRTMLQTRLETNFQLSSVFMFSANILKVVHQILSVIFQMCLTIKSLRSLIIFIIWGTLKLDLNFHQQIILACFLCCWRVFGCSLTDEELGTVPLLRQMERTEAELCGFYRNEFHLQLWNTVKERTELRCWFFLEVSTIRVSNMSRVYCRWMSFVLCCWVWVCSGPTEQKQHICD